VAGTFQVAVVVLPRPGFIRLVPTTIDCKYASIPRVSRPFIYNSLLQVYPSWAVLPCLLCIGPHSQGRMASMGRGRFNTHGNDSRWEASVRLPVTSSDTSAHGYLQCPASMTSRWTQKSPYKLFPLSPTGAGHPKHSMLSTRPSARLLHSRLARERLTGAL
jgi:hypothetical protein